MNANEIAAREGAPREYRGTTGPTTAGGPPEDEPPIPELERTKGIGDTLNGRFLLEQCVGSGSMGTVYKALDLRKLEASDRRPYIAIKVLNVLFRGYPKSFLALQREARKAQALVHPNIVPLYDVHRDGSMVYLSMEYLVGQPLSRILRAPAFRGLPLAQAMPVIGGIAGALAHAHCRGVVHCGLKPANVFLTDRGEVRVVGFGIARAFEQAGEDRDATVFDAGSPGEATPAYASPEMLEQLGPDPRDDIYALGCIAYELLTGQHPFDRVSARHARGAGMKPVRPRHLGYRQWRTLCDALRFEREARTASVDMFIEGIGAAHRPVLHAAFAGAVAAVTVTIMLAAVAGRHRSGHPPLQENGGSAESSLHRHNGPPGDARDPSQSRSMSVRMQPMPPQGASAALTALLSGIACSALSAAVHEPAVEVTGFLSRDIGIDGLKARLAQIPGVTNAAVDVQLVGAQACGAIAAFGPYWLKSRQSGATVRTRAIGGRMTEGEPLILDVTTPDHDSWVHIDHFGLDGGVTHLLPSPRARDHQAPPSHSATIGSFGTWIVSKPFGSEIIVLVAAPAPLFERLRPEHETAAAYLRAARKRLRQMSETYGPDKIAVDFVQISTGPRKR